jgi:hypothetical protein
VLSSEDRRAISLIKKYRDYVRHLTKNYNLSDSDMDEFVDNWNDKFDISQMTLSLIDEDIEGESGNQSLIFKSLH